jgi:hypothetical protein
MSDVDRLLVVRDDLLPGGTKRRALAVLLHGANEFVYASPAQGYAQVALAYAARDLGVRATIFTARRHKLHNLTLEAHATGAKVVLVKTGYFSNVRAKARAYCDETGALLLPFGLDTPAFVSALADVARRLPVQPTEVWSVAGSGTLSRALQQAWPTADVYAVRIGRLPQAGRATIYMAPEAFEQDAKSPPPFPSCSNYDAKAWQFIRQYARTGALFWNVAA